MPIYGQTEITLKSPFFNFKITRLLKKYYDLFHLDRYPIILIVNGVEFAPIINIFKDERL